MEKPHISGKTDFATGRSNFKQETLTKHASSGGHGKCCDVCLDHTGRLLRVLDTQRAKEFEHTQNDLIVKFNTAYTIVEEMTFTKFRSLLALQKKNSIVSNDVKCAQLVGSIADCLKKVGIWQ